MTATPDDPATPWGDGSGDQPSKITQGEVSVPAVRFRAFEVPACLFLRGHRPTWGDDEYAPRRWREAARSWLALHPAPRPGSHWLHVRAGERVRQPTPAELSRMLRWAQRTEGDLPALAAEAREAFGWLWDRDWVAGQRGGDAAALIAAMRP